MAKTEASESVRAVLSGPQKFALLAEMAVEIMTPFPVSIRGETTVAEAAALLTEKGLSALPVVDADGRPIGVLSRTDIARIERRRRAEGVRAAEVMTTPAQVVSPRDGVDAVVRKLAGRNIHRVYVVDDWGRLAGVISALDVVRNVLI